MDRAEHEPVAAVVDDGGAEAEAAAHVAEGVVAHDRDVAQGLPEVGAQGREVGVTRGAVVLQRREPPLRGGGAPQEHDEPAHDEHHERQGDREQRRLGGVDSEHTRQARRSRPAPVRHSTPAPTRRVRGMWTGAPGIRPAA